MSDDELYEIGQRDGYEKAVQDIDLLTGGDGEYRFCTNGDPDRHTPDAATMKARIVARFEDLRRSPPPPSSHDGLREDGLRVPAFAETGSPSRLDAQHSGGGFAPGPWHSRDDLGVWKTGGGAIAQCFWVSGAITVEQAEANAILIAAAPAYWAAAAPLVAEIAFYEPSAGEDDDELVSVRLGDLKALRAAHLKASGAAQ